MSGERMINKAIMMTTGGKFMSKKATGGTIRLKKIKRMALSEPTMYKEPTKARRGAQTETREGKPKIYQYGDLTVREYTNGALLTFGRAKEWYDNPNLAFRNYKLIKSYMMEGEHDFAPTREEFHELAPAFFAELAERIVPDLRRAPSKSIMGYLIERNNRFGRPKANPLAYGPMRNILVYDYEGGALLKYGDKVEWFAAGPRKKLAWDKAELLSNAWKSI